MRAEIRKRLEEIEAGFGPPTIMGLWAHDNGRPTFHQLKALGMNLERWFATGELPKGTEFMGVICTPESERLWTPEPERREPWEFTPTEAELHERWEPFPELHPDTLKQFRKMQELGYYTFINGALMGMNGPLPLSEQRRDLYPLGGGR